MHHMAPFCLLCLVILQQTINAATTFSFEQNQDKELKRLPAARRLRAPLMGRSITSTLNDGSNLVEHQLNDINNNDDENESIDFNERRYVISSLGRRRWMALKRRGPLFG